MGFKGNNTLDLEPDMTTKYYANVNIGIGFGEYMNLGAFPLGSASTSCTGL
jgi:hypothetical protein